MRMERNFRHVTKAAFAFAFTTATYLLARTTGFLPSWFNLSDEASALSSGGMIGQRRLLQQGEVTVANPIPDQVIQVDEQYTYSLNNIFSGNYSLLDVVETGKQSLPNWLSLQPKLLPTFLAGAESAYGVVTNGTTLYLSNYYWISYEVGLQILDISDPSNPQLISSYPSISTGGFFCSGGMAIRGSNLFVADGGTLWILDMSVLTNPRLLSTYSGPSCGVAVSGNTTFIVGYAGLYLIDVTNTSNPKLSSSFPAGGGYPSGVAVKGKSVFVANQDVGLQIFDCSNVSLPRLLSTFPAYSAEKITVNGNLAFLLLDSGVLIIDVSNESNPRYLSIYESGTDRYYDIGVIGNTAFLSRSFAGLQVLDISNVSNCRLLFTFPAGAGGEVFQTAISGNNIFVADADGGVLVLDMSQPNLIGVPPSALVGQRVSLTINAKNMNQELLKNGSFALILDLFPRVVTSAISDQSIYPGDVLTLSLNAELLFTNPSLSFLEFSLELDNKKAIPSWLSLKLLPTQLSICSVQARAIKVAVSGTIAYVSDELIGLKLIDVSQPNNPRLLSTYPGYIRDIVINNNIAFVAADSSGLFILNVSDPNNPRLLSTFPAGSGEETEGVAVEGTTAFIANLNNLSIVDISNLSNPRLISSFSAGEGQIYGVAVKEGIAYVANAGLGLNIVDVRNTSNPQLLSIVVGGSVFKVMISEKIAFADVGNGLHSFDISNITNPQHLTFYVYSKSATARGTTGFFASNIGFQAFDLKNGSNPQLIGVRPALSDGAALDLAVGGNTAFVAYGSGGLQILDLSRWELTAIPNTVAVGNYHLQLIATDELGGSVSSQPFTIRVEGPPQFHSNISMQFAKVGQVFNYFIPQSLVIDPNFDAIVFAASLASGQSLPSWLSFNTISATFSGIPRETNTGNFTILLSATDNIAGSANTTFGLYVDHAPTLNQPIAAQVVGVGLHYQLVVPSATIIDLDNDVLRYTARQQNGSPLPSWLSFNNITHSFSGITNQTNSYTLVLSASDPYGGQASAVFNLLVENFPRINQSVAAPVADVGRLYSFVIPGNSFSDLDNEPLTYGVQQSSSSALPNWLAFNPADSSLSGVPSLADLGELPLLLTATDPHGGSASQNFTIIVTHFPTVAIPIVNQLANAGHFFQMIISNNTFVDLDNNETLSYSAQSSGGLPLPNWLRFNTTACEFSGTPNVTQIGDYSLIVIASDPHGATVTASFNLLVENFLNQSIVPPPAGVGIPFNYLLPVNSLALNYRVTFSDGSSLPNWLSFNPNNVLLSGVPQSTDRGLLQLQLIASSPNGGSAQEMFNLSVTYFPTVSVPIPNQLADVGRLFQMMVSNNTFLDLDANALLAYSAQSIEGLPLPNWLVFNATTRQFSGTPNATQVGNYALTVIASDPYGATATAGFNLLVENFLNQSIDPLSAGVGISFNYLLPVSSLALSYRVTLIGGGSLPNWLSFNPNTLLLLGVPQSTDRGLLQLQLIASSSSGGNARETFNLSVIDFPQVINPIVPPSSWQENRWSTFQVPNNTFRYAVSYNASQSNSLPLPSWLEFNTTTRIFSGTPVSSGVPRSLSLIVIGADAFGNAARALFDLAINPNYLPQIVAPVSDQLANVNQRFAFFIPAESFMSRNQEALSYSASQSHNRPLPNWLHFDNESLSFSGTPGRGDTDPFSPRTVPILVSIKDSGGEVKAAFNINVQGTSWYGLALIIGGPLISGLSFLYAAYQYRALYYNCRNKKHYQKLNTEPTLIVGEPFYYALAEEKIEAVKINTIQAKIPKMQKQCCGFFNSISQENFQALPGGQLLPSWMEYDMEQNCLRSDGPVPSLNYKNLRIEVSDEAGIILKQINLSVQKSKSLNIALEEEAATFISAEAKHASENAASEVELQPLNPPENLTPRLQGSSTPSRSSTLSALSVTNSGNKEGQPTRTGKVELSNLSSF